MGGGITRFVLDELAYSDSLYEREESGTHVDSIVLRNPPPFTEAKSFGPVVLAPQKQELGDGKPLYNEILIFIEQSPAKLYPHSAANTLPSRESYALRMPGR